MPNEVANGEEARRVSEANEDVLADWGIANERDARGGAAEAGALGLKDDTAAAGCGLKAGLKDVPIVEENAGENAGEDDAKLPTGEVSPELASLSARFMDLVMCCSSKRWC